MATTKQIAAMRAAICEVETLAASLKEEMHRDHDTIPVIASFEVAAAMMRERVDELEEKILSYKTAVLRDSIDPRRGRKRSWPVKDL